MTKPSPRHLAATAVFQQPAQPIGRLHPGDRVRFIGGTCTFTIIEQLDGALYRLRSESGAECRAGWRVLERVEVTT